MAHDLLRNAKKSKNDEFYTQYEDIEKEVNEYYEYNKNVFKNRTILLPCDDPEWSNFTKYFAANFAPEPICILRGHYSHCLERTLPRVTTFVRSAITGRILPRT